MQIGDPKKIESSKQKLLGIELNRNSSFNKRVYSLGKMQEENCLLSQDYSI